MIVFKSNGLKGDIVIKPKNTLSRIHDILRRMKKREIHMYKKQIENPWNFYDIEGGIHMCKSRIKDIKSLGTKNLEISYDGFGGNCHITNIDNGNYHIFFGSDFNKLLGFKYTKN